VQKKSECFADYGPCAFVFSIGVNKNFAMLHDSYSIAVYEKSATFKTLTETKIIGKIMKLGQ